MTRTTPIRAPALAAGTAPHQAEHAGAGMTQKLRKVRLRWEPHAGGAWGYSGQLVVAMVGERDEGVFYYHLSAVHTKWITKGSGECGTLARAKASAERGWSAWCAEAGLAPVSET